jgi:hypothetical protein
MNNIFISVFIVSGLLMACHAESDKSQGNENVISLKYDTSKIAIIPWDSARWLFKDRGFERAELTQEELSIIDSLVHVCVIGYNQELNLPAEHKAYGINWEGRNCRQQLVAVTNAKGEKEVWVNCFCYDWHRSWQTNILVVRDGGSCYFNVMINLTTYTFYDLSVNGFA